MQQKKSRKSKGKSRADNGKEIASEERKEVEVLYVDGKWYRGWLSSFNFNTGKWKVEFYDDSETTEVKFLDKDV